MTKQHEKSSCCRGKIIRFGGRRRQCVICRKTWRAWQRTRGRDRKRVDQALLTRILNGYIISIQKEAERRRVHESALRRKLIAAIQQHANIPWNIALQKNSPLVLLADAILKRIEQKWLTVYFTAVKRPHESIATLLPPTILVGKESFAGWRSALNAIEDNIHKNIAAMVCDGHRGLVYYARYSGWQVQRCQAHLLFSIAGRRSRSPWSRHREEGARLYNLAKEAMSTRDEKAFIYACNAIEEMGWTTSSQILKMIISGFVREVDNYRTYLAYPELDIPKTNNALESFISQFQELCHRARGFATPQALSRWVIVFTKHKKVITCNGDYQPN